MMKNTGLLFACLLICGCFAAVPQAAAAESAATIKANMQKRLPAVNALLKKTVIGEANTGYLAVLGEVTDEDKKLVEAENRDRKTVYAAIARQQGATVELVGQRRAKQIAERAAAGTRYQDADGKWQTKSK